MIRRAWSRERKQQMQCQANPREVAAEALGPRQGSPGWWVNKTSPWALEWGLGWPGNVTSRWHSCFRGSTAEAGKGRRWRRGYQSERKRGPRSKLWGKAHQKQGRWSQSQMEGETQRGCQRGLGSSLQDQGDGELQASAGRNMDWRILARLLPSVRRPLPLSSGEGLRSASASAQMQWHGRREGRSHPFPNRSFSWLSHSHFIRSQSIKHLWAQTKAVLLTTRFAILGLRNLPS